MYRML